MRVKLKRNWFVPTEKRMKDSRSMSGAFYPKGIHKFPDSWAEILPSDAEILDGKPDPEPTPTLDLRAYDMERAASDAMGELMTEAQKQMARARQARLEKLAAKRAAKEANKE